MKESTQSEAVLTVGLDLGDRFSAFCVLDAQGEVVDRGQIRTQPQSLRRHFAILSPRRVVFEVGVHSAWVCRMLEALGHKTIVANPRRVRLISQSQSKTDRNDAECLARLGRVDPQLLAPIHHRGAQAQADLALLRARDTLVRVRSALVNHVRGAVKSFGARIPSGSSACFGSRASKHLPPELASALEPLLQQIKALSLQIGLYERESQEIASKRYPETAKLRQVSRVGPLTALAFVLTLEDPSRFTRSRQVGAYLGLRPRRRDSGKQSPQLGITKAGDPFVRRLLVLCAHQILGPFGADSDLRRWALAKAKSGGSIGKKKAVVALARKLAVLLHRLWLSGEVYEPLRQAKQAAA